MASPGQLARCISDILQIPQPTVTEIDRRLVTFRDDHHDGLRSKAGRGKSAARVTARDAATLLIATLAAPVAGPVTVRAVDTYFTYAFLPLSNRHGEDVGLPSLQALPDGHTFATAIETLIESAVSGELQDAFAAHRAEPASAGFSPHVEISIVAPSPRADISVRLKRKSLGLHYGRAEAPTIYTDTRAPKGRPFRYSDLRQVREITHRTILEIARVLADEPVPTGNEFAEA